MECVLQADIFYHKVGLITNCQSIIFEKKKVNEKNPVFILVASLEYQLFKKKRLGKIASRVSVRAIILVNQTARSGAFR